MGLVCGLREGAEGGGMERGESSDILERTTGASEEEVVLCDRARIPLLASKEEERGVHETTDEEVELVKAACGEFESAVARGHVQ